MTLRNDHITKGFTLLELMVTVAVIGITATVAVPAYQDYVIRSKVSEALIMGSAQKIAVIESYASNGLANVNALNTGSPALNNPSPYVAEIVIEEGGQIVMRTRETGAAISPVLALVPREAGGAINWECQLLVGLPKHVPAMCRGGGGQVEISFRDRRPNVVHVVSAQSGTGFTVKPAGDTIPRCPHNDTNPRCTADEPALLTNGNPAYSGRLELQNIEFDLVTPNQDGTLGGWGIAFQANGEGSTFSGYVVQFERRFPPTDLNGTPQMIIRQWQNGVESSQPLRPPGRIPLPNNFNMDRPGDVVVEVKDNVLTVSSDGHANLLKHTIANPQEGYFGIRTWNGNEVTVGAAQVR